MHLRTLHTRAGRRSGIGVLAVAVAAIGTLLTAPHADATPSSATTLVVNADQPFRPVTHVASGSLYGLADDMTPSDDLSTPLHANTYVQMAPGGHQLPNGEPAPAGDSLVVAGKAAAGDSKVIVRMPDWYPNFPYRWVSWNDWLSAVDTQIASVKTSGATNVSAYELWNEPDWTWDTSNAGNFNAGWVRTYDEVRSRDTTTPVDGPSYSHWDANAMRTFLTYAQDHNALPDIISWHELGGDANIAADVAAYRALESSLGISPRPVSIEEYGTPDQVGVPGQMVGYIAKFERAGVDNAEMAFWNHYGTLGDTLIDTGGSPNGAYWLYKWYGDMTGAMVTTVPPAQAGIDGAAAVTRDKRQVSVIFGGGSGSSAVTVTGLDKLHSLDHTVNVKLEYTPSRGRTTAVPGPITISETNYKVKDGSITVPVAMNPANGYHLVITPSGKTTSLAGTYKITNFNSGLALDTQNEGTAKGTLVDQATPGRVRTQAWKIVPAGSGLYKIVNKGSGLLLGMSNASTEAGGTALIWGDNGAPDHLWQLIPDGNGHFKIANYGSGLILGVTGMSTASGAQVIQWADGSITSANTATGARVPGKLGNALRLSGDNESVNLPSGIVSSLGDFTVSTWVNPTQNSTWSRLFDFGTGTTDNMFLTVNDGTSLRFAITTSGGGGEQRIEGTGTLPLNTWSLVTVTVSGGTGTLYVDGKVIGTNTHMTLHPADLGTTNQNWIGRSQYGSDPFLKGEVDDFTVYSRALSASEVDTLASGQPGAGDVAHYAFDEAGGATAIDSSGNERNATIVSDPQSSNADDSATPDHLWTLKR
jgi:hypothetical protein